MRPAATSKPRPPASLPMPARPEPPLPVWRVVSVHDGDTLRAIDERKAEQRIRLAGIDAPERGQPFGNVARKRLAALTMGKAVAVDVEDRDRYGRTAARLKADGLDVGRQMVSVHDPELFDLGIPFLATTATRWHKPGGGLLHRAGAGTMGLLVPQLWAIGDDHARHRVEKTIADAKRRGQTSHVSA
jgi:hypothetical protein